MNAHSATSDPAKAIADAAVAGQLDEKRLAALITEAAQRQLVANYRQELRARSERMFVEQFHRSLLKNGRADAILDSLHPSFDTAAEAIAAARDVIPTEAPAEKFLRIAQPAALAVWQGLGEHLSVIDRIGRIAAQFGPRNGNFPLIEEYTLGDGFRLEDRAIWCADGPDLESDSRAFRQPDRGHRTSPWVRIPLRLNTVAEARERYRRWAEASWDATHPNRVVQHQKPNGSVGRVRDLKSKCRKGISEMTTPGEQRPPTSPPGTSGPGAQHSAPVEGGRSRDRMFLKLLHELVGGGWGWRIAAAK